MANTNGMPSRGMWASAGLFLHALGRGWWFVVLGAVAGLLGLYQQVGGEQIAWPLWAWYAASVLGLLVGAFVAFHHVRLERDELADEVRRRTPHMRLKIVGADSFWDDRNKKQMVYLHVILINRYQQAAVLAWMCEMVLADGRRFRLRTAKPYANEAIPVLSEGGRGPVQLIRQDSLITHKAATPIEDSGFRAGGYLASLVGVSERVPVSEGDTFHLSCLDTHDQEWKASFTTEYLHEGLISPFGSDDIILGPPQPEGDGT